MKHQPNITVVDVANLVAAQKKERNIFSSQRHAGGPNIREKTHQLDISLEWLNSAHETANQQPTAHLITGSNDHFCFFDRFHKSNPQKEREVFQRVTHVQQLNGLINTQHQEQLYNVFNR
jgi:hypothetical protein